MASKAASIPEPVAADDVKRLEFVDDNKNYYVTLQMGGNSSWREFSGKRRVAQALPGGGMSIPKYEPVIHHRVGPFDGWTVNGLIAAHNEWVADYSRKSGRYGEKWAGHVDRQRLVLATEETSDLPAKSKRQVNSLNAFQSMIEGIVQKQVSELIGTGA